MAKQSKAAKIEANKEELRKAEKLLGSARWALTGAGAKKNPPKGDRKTALEARVAMLTDRVAELRAQPPPP